MLAPSLCPHAAKYRLRHIFAARSFAQIGRGFVNHGGDVRSRSPVHLYNPSLCEGAATQKPLRKSGLLAKSARAFQL
jgi:hypothetical protein